MSQEARIDKWLWAARIFKTRSIAIDACKNGRVTIDGARTKPSHLVKAGDIISVRKPPITYTFKIKQAIERRVGAKLIPEILADSSIAPKVPEDPPRKNAEIWTTSLRPLLWTRIFLMKKMTTMIFNPK